MGWTEPKSVIFDRKTVIGFQNSNWYWSWNKRKPLRSYRQIPGSTRLTPLEEVIRIVPYFLLILFNNFVSPEPALKVSPRHKVYQELSEGKRGNVSCRIEGNVASYRWVLPNDKPLSSRVRAVGNVLTISPVLTDDAGTYLCVAQGGSDNDQVVEARVNVTIQGTCTST